MMCRCSKKFSFFNVFAVIFMVCIVPQYIFSSKIISSCTSSQSERFSEFLNKSSKDFLLLSNEYFDEYLELARTDLKKDTKGYACFFECFFRNSIQFELDSPNLEFAFHEIRKTFRITVKDENDNKKSLSEQEMAEMKKKINRVFDEQFFDFFSCIPITKRALIVLENIWVRKIEILGNLNEEEKKIQKQFSDKILLITNAIINNSKISYLKFISNQYSKTLSESLKNIEALTCAERKIKMQEIIYYYRDQVNYLIESNSRLVKIFNPSSNETFGFIYGFPSDSSDDEDFAENPPKRSGMCKIS